MVSSAPTSSVVTVVYLHGDCDSLISAQANQSSTEVTFKIKVREHADVCDDAGRENVIRIRLGKPLGNRTISGSCTACVSGFDLKSMSALSGVPTYGS